MKKLYPLIALFAFTAIPNINPMDPARNPMFSLIDQFIGNDALGTTTNWDAVFALLKKLAQEGNAFTANEYLSIDNLTLLAKAVEDNNLLVAKKLMAEWGARPNTATRRNGMTPLMIASFNGNGEMVKLLMEWGGNPYIKNNEGHDSFYFAERYYQLNRHIQNRLVFNILKTYQP